MAKEQCIILASVLEECGVRDVVVSPGSRNTPLVLAFDAYDNIRKTVIVDERSAAFVALGITQATQSPVALVCTSGTALLNYAPAVAEAYYTHVPLIVISADRPQEWIDQDDSQTLRQFDALRNFVKKSYDFPEFNPANAVWPTYINRMCNDAFASAVGDVPGPVHINVQLDAPLNKIPEKLPESTRIVEVLEPEMRAPLDRIKELARSCASRKVLVIAGFMPPDNKLQQSMAMLASLPNVYVMAETVSNLHLPGEHCAIDTILSHIDAAVKEELKPDVVITLGGALISRMVKEWLRSIHAEHWTLGRMRTTVDCFLSLKLRIEATPAPFLKQFAISMKRAGVASVPAYRAMWEDVKKISLKRRNERIRSIGWCEMSALDVVFNSLPKDCNLQISNGTPIRYAQLLMRRVPHTCFCNRGVSGIDGSVSTAVGYAMASNSLTVLVTGDLSFAYDIGILANPEIPSTLRIIVMNNAGGGIFRFVKSTASLPCRERYFGADQKLDFDGIAGAFGFEFHRADNAEALKQELKTFFNPSDKPRLLEIKADADYSAEVLTNFLSGK